MSDAAARPAAPKGDVEYTIRRKALALLGAKFHIFDRDDNLVGFSKQKAFKLKEDIRIFKDESMEEEWIKIAARSVIDFSAVYDVTDSRTGAVLGSLRRKGLKSILRDSWQLLDEDGNEVGQIEEDSAVLAMIRRLHGLLAAVIPQKYTLKTGGDREIATYSTSANPFIHKLNVTVFAGCPLHPFVPLAAGLLLVAIEGRQ